MSSIHQWAAHHNISTQAMRDLVTLLSAPADLHPQDAATGHSEAAGQQKIRLAAPKAGARLWRNNVGACVDDSGNFIRYGLANESKAMNKVMKSSDLIGITPVTHAGLTFGVFTAIECKAGDWQYKGTAHELAQLAFHEMVIGLGGRAQFARGVDDLVIF